METVATDKTEEKQGLWQKNGPSPNPSGRPKGSKNKATLAIQELLEGEGEKIARKAIELATEGDISAIKCVLERIIPPVKSKPINIDLPKVSSAKDSLEATSKVIQAVSEGEITPQEGLSVINILERFAKAYEISELEQRVTKLERNTYE